MRAITRFVQWFAAVYQGLAGLPRPGRTVYRAIWNPARLVRALRRSGSRIWIDRIFGSESEYRRLAGELEDSRELDALLAALEAKFKDVAGSTSRGVPYAPGTIKRLHAVHLYALVRCLRPARVVETGVCNGLSSAVILRAMQVNRTGRLYSIDLPEFTGDAAGASRFWHGKGGAVVPAGMKPGWLVDKELLPGWDLRLGRSDELLPRLMQELGQIDCFLHDSEHSFENQRFEFDAAARYLRPGGVLLASDTGASGAFDEFCAARASEVEVFWVDHSLALALKH